MISTYVTCLFFVFFYLKKLKRKHKTTDSFPSFKTHYMGRMNMPLNMTISQEKLLEYLKYSSDSNIWFNQIAIIFIIMYNLSKCMFLLNVLPN